MQFVDGEVLEEKVFTNCTVVCYTNIITGEQKICWWDNTDPSSIPPPEVDEYDQ